MLGKRQDFRARVAGTSETGGAKAEAMFRTRDKLTGFGAALAMGEVIYHATVRSVRQTNRSAVGALIVNMLQTMMLVAVFYIMFAVLGMRGNAVRGDFLLYIMSGVFLYMTFTKTMSSVLGAAGPTSAMMLHAPMNTLVAIVSNALGALYVQVLSVTVVLGIYWLGFEKFTIQDPAGAFSMLLLAWFNGAAFGMVFFALKPWAPTVVGLVSSLYSRANMIASGKMFLANTLSYTMLKMFDWNPLFHIIDQARGFTFINYNPHNSNLTYPIAFSFALLMLGFIGESYTRKAASLSWGAGN